MSDSREQLANDISGFFHEWVDMETIRGWLDRQAAITRAECEKPITDMSGLSANDYLDIAIEEREEWKAKAEKYHSLAASYECDRRCSQGQCNWYEENMCECDSPWCDEVLNVIDMENDFKAGD